jgi:hypothetical protein
MKIAVFETEHFEGAFPVIRLFDAPGNELAIYTSEETQKRFNDLLQADAKRYQWMILPTVSKPGFFYTLYKKLKKDKPDILYINTISNNHLLYALVLWLLPLKRVVMTVHDINCLFESRFGWGFRKAIIHWGKKWLIGQVHEFNVVSDTMIPYLKTKTKQKPTHNIPGAVFEFRQAVQTLEKKIRIVIPGSLDKRRRDYDQVFQLATMADQKKLNLQIILLGGYFDDYGEAVSAKADAFQSAFCSVTAYHTRIVDQDEFDRQMDAAHFVFIPSVIDTNICGDIPETYGITKSSGNIFDVIKHAKPFIVPANLAISPALQTSCTKYYHPDEIITFLLNLLNSPTSYDHWQHQALLNSENFTIEKVRERNQSLFKV